jgi:hypothetical protein
MSKRQHGYSIQGKTGEEPKQTLPVWLRTQKKVIARYQLFFGIDKSGSLCYC